MFRKWFLFIAMGMLVLSVVGCTKQEEEPKPAAQEEVIEEKAEDLVCGMEIDKEIAQKAEYEGKAYYFCSAHCKDTFLKEPEKYIR